MTTYSPLATPSATRATLERFGLSTKYSLGQNFLVNDAIIGHICQLSQVRPDDVVLEVGPGIGTLTAALCPRAGQVISVERDPDLPPVLDETLADYSNFTLIGKDALDLTEADLQGRAPNKFIANLPYAVAATLVLDYFTRFDSIQSATVMVQKEVADRMSAPVGTKDYGAYTVKLQLLARATDRFPVSPNNFFPPPRVESSVIRIDRVAPSAAQRLGRPVADAAAVAADAAFAQRRKTILNSMRGYFKQRKQQYGEVDVAALLADAGIDARRRGETLTLDEFLTLGQALAARL